MVWSGLTFLEVLANYPTDSYELGCDLKLETLLVSRILVLQGHDYLVTSFPASSADASLFFGGARYERLKSLVSLLKYTQHLNNSTINTFVNSRSRTRLPLYLRSFFYVCVRLSRDFGHFSLVMFCVSLARTLLTTLKPNSSIS